MLVRSKIIPGRPDIDNKGAIDWRRQNLLALGCQSYVIVYEPTTLTVVQTLDEHRAKVCVLRW
jgi:hypothetical protein